MPDQDELTAAVKEVSDGIVSIERPKLEYPIPDEGMHDVTCTQAELSENTHPKAQPGSMVVKLTFQTEKTYEGSDGEDHHYMVWSKPFGLFFGPKAGLHKCFKDLTGKTPDLLLKKEIIKKDGKDFTREVFKYNCFEGMTCQVLVKHRESEDGSKTFANIDAFVTDGDQKAFNLALVEGDDAPEPAPKEEPKKEPPKEKAEESK